MIPGPSIGTLPADVSGSILELDHHDRNMDSVGNVVCETRYEAEHGNTRASAPPLQKAFNKFGAVKKMQAVGFLALGKKPQDAGPNSSSGRSSRDGDSIKETYENSIRLPMSRRVSKGKGRSKRRTTVMKFPLFGRKITATALPVPEELPVEAEPEFVEQDEMLVMLNKQNENTNVLEKSAQHNLKTKGGKRVILPNSSRIKWWNTAIVPPPSLSLSLSLSPMLPHAHVEPPSCSHLPSLLLLPPPPPLLSFLLLLLLQELCILCITFMAPVNAGFKMSSFVIVEVSNYGRECEKNRVEIAESKSLLPTLATFTTAYTLSLFCFTCQRRFRS